VSNKLDIAHIYSTIISIISLIIFNGHFFVLDLNNLILVILNLFVFSYIYITFPGGFASSIRLFLLSEFVKKKKIRIITLNKMINDQSLFNDRFRRLEKYGIIKKRNNKYFLHSKKVFFLIKFIKINRKIYHFIKK
tara:strand:- start:254 stop:661 length:408 start_codon:yes stop_codon:yes gene_type:complete